MFPVCSSRLRLLLRSPFFAALLFAASLASAPARAAQENWAPVDIAVSRTDNTTRLLWRDPAGRYAVWKLSPTGAIQTGKIYGPVAGYTCDQIVVAPNGEATLLWKNPYNKQAALWTLKADLSAIVKATVYAYPVDYTPSYLAADQSSQLRLSWRGKTGAAFLWTITPATGAVNAATVYGPYAGLEDGPVAVGADGRMRLLWRNKTTGGATLWTIPAAYGTPSAGYNYNPVAGAVASDIAVGADNKTRLQWTYTTGANAGKIALWKINSAVGGTGAVEVGKFYGPLAGVSPLGLSVGGDNQTRQLWRYDATGKAALWIVSDSLTSITGAYTYGPLPASDPGPGTTQPRFAPAVTYALQGSAEQVTTGDFDNDGNADVAVGTDLGLAILWGKGDGTLSAPAIVNAHTTFGVRCAADINNDGKMDLVCGDNNGVYVILNNGSRRFALSINVNTGSTVSAAAFSVPGQANKQIASVMQNQNLTGSVPLVRLQNGALQQVGSYSPPGFPIAVAAGDLTNDGLPDLVATYLSSTFGQSGAMVFPNLGDGTFGPGARYDTGTQDPVGADVNDFNADGRPDLAVANYWDNNVSVSLNNGGSSALGSPAHYPAGAYPRFVHSARFDRDNWRDMVVANAGTTRITVLWNRGDTFTRIEFETGGDNSRSLDVADFNNDGKMDIVVGNESTGNISILLNTTP